MLLSMKSISQIIGIMALSVVLLVAMGSTVRSADGATPRETARPLDEVAAVDQKVQPSWAEILGKAALLRSRTQLGDDSTITMRVGRVSEIDAGAWNAEPIDKGGVKAVKIVFRRRGADQPAATYVISPWQRLWWKGPAGAAPKVMTVNKHAVVLGPIAGGDQSAEGKKLAQQSEQIMAQISGKAFCEDGVSDGIDHNTSTSAVAPVLVRPRPIHRSRPYYLVVDYPATYLSRAERRVGLGASAPVLDTPPWNLSDDQAQAWRQVVSKRMLLVIMRKNDPKAPDQMVRYEFFTPAEIDRSRPRPFDRGEQRLSSDVDLTAAYATLDRQIRAIFDRALDNAFRFDNKFVKEDRQQIVENQLANLKKAIFAHPGHSGPAHAAGAGAFEQAKRQLEQLLVAGQFPAFDKNHWASSLSTYRSDLIEQLAALPAANVANLDKLLDQFKRLQKSAKKNPGMHPARFGSYMPSADELLWAEVGDRIRTLVNRRPATKIKAAIIEKLGGQASLAYPAYRLSVNHPTQRYGKDASTPIVIHIPLIEDARFNPLLDKFGIKDNGNMNSAKYFDSPKQAVEKIRQMLRNKDWHELAVHYDISGDIDPMDLLSGKFFYRKQRPENADPMGLWQYKHPFHPAYSFSHVDKTANADVVQVFVKIKIDQGGGPAKVGFGSFLMRKGGNGYQVIPAIPKRPH